MQKTPLLINFMTGDSDKKTVWKFLVENIVYFLFEHHTEILNFFKIICFLRYRYFSSVYIGDLFLYLHCRYFSSVYTGNLFLYLSTGIFHQYTLGIYSFIYVTGIFHQYTLGIYSFIYGSYSFIETEIYIFSSCKFSVRLLFIFLFQI